MSCSRLPLYFHAIRISGMNFGFEHHQSAGTFVVFDRETGKPLHNAIVWQCGRGPG